MNQVQHGLFSPSEKEKILFINFNQDQGCFAVGTDSGFKIFNSYPFKMTISRYLGGGVGYVEMLYRSNIFILIGGGANPIKPLNKLTIWDDNENNMIGEMTFKTDIIRVKLQPHKLIVILKEEVFIHKFPELCLEYHIKTCQNSKGLLSINNDVKNTIIATPDITIGNVIIHLYEHNKKNIIKAHQSNLSFLELNSSGNLLATSSEKGMVIRIYDTYDGKHLQELRRGLEYAQIYSLSFDSTSMWLVMSCDSGSVHIFNLLLHKSKKENKQANENIDQTSNYSKNPTSKLWFLKSIVPYFDSEWSFAKYKGEGAIITKVGFVSAENTLIAVNYSGNCFYINYDPINGGECKKGNIYSLI